MLYCLLESPWHWRRASRMASWSDALESVQFQVLFWSVAYRLLLAVYGYAREAFHQRRRIYASHAAFETRAGNAPAFEGYAQVPLVGLTEALASVEGPDAPPRDVLDSGAERAYCKADAVLGEGPDPHGLDRDEIAAVNLGRCARGEGLRFLPA